MPKRDPFSPLDVRFVTKRRWVLLKDLVFLPTWERVRAGLETDFASIPRMFWGLLSPFGKYAKAAIFHDAGYALAADRSEQERKILDDRFLEMMKASGVNWVTRNLIHRAVRDFGAIVFHRRHESQVLSVHPHPGPLPPGEGEAAGRRVSGRAAP